MRCAQGWARFERIVERVEPAQINGEFAPDEHFIEEGIFVVLRGLGILDGKRDGERADMSEMEIGRKARAAIEFGLVTFAGVTV